jgi:hypothetical protein
MPGRQCGRFWLDSRKGINMMDEDQQDRFLEESRQAWDAARGTWLLADMHHLQSVMRKVSKDMFRQGIVGHAKELDGAADMVQTWIDGMGE